MKSTYHTQHTKFLYIIKMNTLPPELITIIVTYIQKITDKRQFTQTCITYNNITKSIIQNQKLKLEIKYFSYPNNYCKEQFILELCNDSYFNKIPDHYLTTANENVVKALTIYGQIELLEKAIENGSYLFKEIGNYEYNDYDFEYDNSCAHAVMGGNIDMLTFVRLCGCEWDGTTFECAAKYNHLHILKFLKKHKCEISNYASVHVAENGNIEMMKWLIVNSYVIHDETCQTAAAYGHLDMLKLLRQGNYYWDIYTCLMAAKNGQLECLQWSIENGCDFDVSYIYSDAACFNQLHIIKWMRSKGYVWDSKTCANAAKNNHFELLKWLVKEGCELDINVYDVALRYFNFNSNNNADMLQWLKDSNCPTH